METNIESFETAQTALNEAKKLRDQAYATKQAALQGLRNVVVNVARIQEGYYRLAGLDDLADRMRLTIPKPRKPAPGNSSEGSATEPAAEPNPEPDSP